MDYLNIVLIGYINPTTNNHFQNYLLREYKKAEKENYSIDEFYEGCLKATEYLNKENIDRFYKRKNELYQLIDMAKNDKLGYTDLKENQTKADYKNELIKNCENELEIKEPFGYGVPLFVLTNGKFTGHLYYEQIKEIEKEIKIVFNKQNTLSVNTDNSLNEITNTSKNQFNKIEHNFNISNLIELKKRLNEYYDSYSLSIKADFLEWLELSYLKREKIILNNLKKDLKGTGIYGLKKEKNKFLLNWILEKKDVLNVSENLINKNIESSNHSFFYEILNNNKFERLKKIKKKTNQYDKILLIELVNDFTEFTIDNLYRLNESFTNIPIEKPVVEKGGFCLCIMNFTFYEIRQIENNEFEIISYQNEYFFNRFNYENVSQTFKYTDIIQELNFILSDKHKIISNENLKTVNQTENYKKTFWFKTGLLFANGEIQNLLTQFDYNATKIANHLGNKSYRPFITESISARKHTNTQSIFNPKKFVKIYNHCKEHNIQMTEVFEDYYGKIERDLN